MESKYTNKGLIFLLWHFLPVNPFARLYIKSQALVASALPLLKRQEIVQPLPLDRPYQGRHTLFKE